MNTQPLYPFLPDKAKVRSSFDRAAAHYDEAAILQREVETRLLERLGEVRLTPSIVIDLGAGTGSGTLALMQRYPQALVIATDIAPAMLQQARRRKLGLFAKVIQALKYHGGRRFVCADAEALPFSTSCADLVYSNLTLQWCLDLDRTFTGIRRILRPEGLLVFTTFGPDTLRELRTAWRAVDVYSHVNAFIDMHDIGDALNRAGFGGIVMDVEHLTLTYSDLMGLMKDLKFIGAHNVTHGRPRGLTGRQRLQQLTTAYETFRLNDRLPATYEVIYGHAWSVTIPHPRPVGPVSISLEQLRPAHSP